MYCDYVIEDIYGENLIAGSHPAWPGEDYQNNLAQLSLEGISNVYSFESRCANNIAENWQGENKNHYTNIDGVDITVEDFTAPTNEQLSALVDKVLEDLANNKKVFLHCRGGLGRTGTFLAAIHIKKTGCNANEAISAIREGYDRHAIETRGQEKALSLYQHRLANPHYQQTEETNVERAAAPPARPQAPAPNFFSTMKQTFFPKSTDKSQKVITLLKSKLGRINDQAKLNAFIKVFRQSGSYKSVQSDKPTVQEINDLISAKQATFAENSPPSPSK